MPTSRLEGKTQLRYRIGEPNDATNWTTDTTGESWNQGMIHDFLNTAQRKVAEDTIVPSSDDRPLDALLIDTYLAKLESGVYQYDMPENLIAPSIVIHRPESTSYELREANIRHMFHGLDTDVKQTNLKRFQIYGRRGGLITQGICTTGSNTAVNDTDRTSHATYGFDVVTDDEGNVAEVGDVVWNITDGSSAAISAVTDTDTLTFSTGLTGGFRNVFEQGDVYEVRQQEHNRKTMNVWPIPNDIGASEDVSFTGTKDASIAIGNTGGVEQQVSQMFQTGNANVVLSSVIIELGATTGAPGGNFTVRIETDSSGPSGTLVAPTSKGTLKTVTASGSNEVFLLEPVELAPLTNYHIRAQLPAQSAYYSTNDHYLTWATDTDNGYSGGTSYTFATPTWTAVAANDHFFKTKVQDGEEHLIVHYARYPMSLDSDTDLFEVPEYAMGAVYLYAEYQAYLTARTIDLAKESKREYDEEVARLKKDMLDQYAPPYKAVRQVRGRLPGRHNNLRVTRYDPAKYPTISYRS